MPTLPTRFAAVIAACLLASTGTATAAQADNTAAPAPAATRGGIAHLQTNLDLQPTPSGTWTDSSLQVTLPRAGTYNLDLDVRGRLQGTPPVDAYIVARLWNVTSNAALPQSERLVNQINDRNPGDAQEGRNTTVAISERITVNSPTTIRLQAKRVTDLGTTVYAAILSDTDGYTSFRYQSVSPW
ncbi:hypothetical protein [Streptomyces sp. NPDC058424]|uniref:hypothetical protein n=1 Tax=Streptomyces sp. NPDC058424 TaxID=3346491 RepID=UPI00364C7837